MGRRREVLRRSALNGLPCRSLRERIDFCSLSIAHYPKSSVLRCLHIFSSLLCVWCGLLFCFRQGFQAVRLRSVCVKLLGRDCYDIDIAIDNVLGKEFCEKVNEYSSSKGEEAHKIGVIQCNPDHSKHLETARMRLFDMLTCDLKTTVRIVAVLPWIYVVYMDAAWNLIQLIGFSTFNVLLINYIFRNSLKLKASNAETVINVHKATKNLVSLIPHILSNVPDIKVAEVDWGRGTLDVPVVSELRILAEWSDDVLGSVSHEVEVNEQVPSTVVQFHLGLSCLLKFVAICFGFSNIVVGLSLI
ncbi:uncharacterized protein LOC131309552 [Rhododendron vialii]|uniref:uncharacterized protein LOC131309552 n=1 Tax=Rhododendron vialii TaxID=182163 RepID=UPI00265F95B8|nr:uncharacterized protein LOC131309552 [Rhododendron vialii]